MTRVDSPPQFPISNGVKRPPVDSYKGKTPALGEERARRLLDFPTGELLKDLAYHELRWSELCKLSVREIRQQRRGVVHLKISGKVAKPVLFRTQQRADSLPIS
ncbi:MAG: hypothetical protein OJF47_002224 [Nitrospira sp.]|jgi:hypothetical protein|nr:MAG: hypothetical protein OJF47_002224 [Nitrospira sp.]